MIVVVDFLVDLLFLSEDDDFLTDDEDDDEALEVGNLFIILIFCLNHDEYKME